MERKKMYNSEELIRLRDCQKCEFYRGMNGTFVRCNRQEDIIALVVTMPSNWNVGFTQGEIVLYCEKKGKNI